jgi:hypothetical protein
MAARKKSISELAKERLRLNRIATRTGTIPIRGGGFSGGRTQRPSVLGAVRATVRRAVGAKKVTSSKRIGPPIPGSAQREVKLSTQLIQSGETRAEKRKRLKKKPGS